MADKTVRGLIIIPFDASVETDKTSFTPQEIVEHYNRSERTFAEYAMSDDSEIGLIANDHLARVVVIETIDGHPY